jgi:F0F1-type ATP synthase assembly protein I
MKGECNVIEENKLQFRGGKLMSLIPLCLLIIFAFYFYGFARVYDTISLALGGIVALIIGSFLAKNSSTYWNASIKGMSGELGNVLAFKIGDR